MPARIVVTSGLSASTRTRIDLELDDGAEEASFVELTSPSFELPPGQQLAMTQGEMVVPRTMTLWGIAPRMHALAQSLEVNRLEDANNRCLAAFNHWSFYRQRSFFYLEPVRLDRGDRLRVSCTYNTQSRQEPVRRGDDVRDDDCSALLYVTAK